jgi:glucose-1-phosphate thymidylyltransferase
MRGILLAGGLGTRLDPITRSINKHLIPVYDKPMIYYPLTTLLLADVSEICIVSTRTGVEQFKDLLGSGSQWGIKLAFAIQEFPTGIAGGIKLGLDTFQSPDSTLVILGDNIYHGHGLGRNISELAKGNRCIIWTQDVDKPENFGVASFDSKGRITSITEKPKSASSRTAITGLYYFPEDVEKRILQTKLSSRGELEITDVLNSYLIDERIENVQLSRGVYWLDAGTTSNLVEASQFVQLIQNRQGQLIGSPDEAAWQLGRITIEDFVKLKDGLPDSEYKYQLNKSIANRAPYAP